MEKLTGYLRRTGRQIASMSPAARAGAIGMAMLVAGGGVWLILATVKPAAVPVTAGPTDARHVAAVQAELDRRGISYRIERGRLHVAPECLDEARAILAGLDARTSQAMDNLRKLADRDDIWSSQTEKLRRWQAGKMALLSEQISSLVGVESATVILSPGSPGRFGRPGQAGGASVKLAMRAGMRAGDALCETIADMVTGSVAGIRRQDVCVVDSRGRSYRPAAPPVDGLIDRTRQVEAYYAGRLRKALSYIDGLVVTVRAVAPPVKADQVGRCVGVSVSIPRSYLLAAHRSDGSGQRLEDFASARQLGVERVVMYEAALPDPGAVKVTWYHDAPRHAEAPGTSANAVGNRTAGGDWGSFVRWAVSAVVVLVVGRLLWWRVGGAGVRPGAGQTKIGSGKVPSSPGRSERPGAGPFAFLVDTPAEQLLELLGGEHPQTIALVLAHVGPGKAAAVLAGLEPERQVDVVRRIASLGAPTGEVAGEIARGLAARMGISAAGGDDNAGGISTAAEILHHVGYDGEQAVLDGLKDEAPALADSIRRQLFEFEDIAALSPETVGRALADLPSDDIAVALRTAGDEVKDKILASLAAEAAGHVRQAMDRIGPVRLSDVEAAQQRVATAVRRAGSGRYLSDDTSDRADDYVETGSE